MDSQDIIAAVPVRATHHPFVYCAEGFRVRVGRGSKESLHGRMECKELHVHVTTGTSPTGSELGDAHFYAAQLVHHGIPIDGCKPRAITTLNSLFKMRGGSPVIHVPETVTSIAKTLKKQYDALLIKRRASTLLSKAEAKFRGKKAALVEHEAKSKVLQEKVKVSEELANRYRQELKAKKAELADHEASGKDLLEDVASLEAEMKAYRQQLSARNSVENATGMAIIKNEEEAEGDIRPSDDVPIVTRSNSSKRTLPDEGSTTSTSASTAKRTKIAPTSAPPQPRVLDLVQAARHCSLNPASSDSAGPADQSASSSSAGRPLRSHVLGECSTPAPPVRYDSNPPSAHSPLEHKRRELLKLTSGVWEISTQQGSNYEKNPKFTMSIAKIFQSHRRHQPQTSSAFIKLHLMKFQFDAFVGYGCSTSNGEVVDGKFKMVFTWKASEGPVHDPKLVEERRFELLFDKYSVEGYLYGAPGFANGYLFYGTYACQLPRDVIVMKWHDAYFACSDRNKQSAGEAGTA